MKRPYLILVNAGDQSVHRHWLSDPDARLFDLFINYYHDQPDMYRTDADCYSRIKGFKFPCAHEIIRTNPWILQDYDAVWFPDDDMVMGTADINRFFTIAMEHKLSLAQPAADPQGVPTHLFLQRHPEKAVRFTNFVEINAVLFSRAALNRAWPFFKHFLTGAGADMLLGALFHLQDQAIVDAVQMRHSRKMGTTEVYTKGPNWHDEVRFFQDMFHVPFPYPFIEWGYVPTHGRPVQLVSKQPDPMLDLPLAGGQSGYGPAGAGLDEILSLLKIGSICDVQGAFGDQGRRPAGGAFGYTGLTVAAETPADTMTCQTRFDPTHSQWLALSGWPMSVPASDLLLVNWQQIDTFAQQQVAIALLNSKFRWLGLPLPAQAQDVRRCALRLGRPDMIVSHPDHLLGLWRNTPLLCQLLIVEPDAFKAVRAQVVPQLWQDLALLNRTLGENPHALAAFLRPYHENGRKALDAIKAFKESEQGRMIEQQGLSGKQEILSRLRYGFVDNQVGAPYDRVAGFSAIGLNIFYDTAERFAKEQGLDLRFDRSPHSALNHYDRDQNQRYAQRPPIHEPAKPLQCAAGGKAAEKTPVGKPGMNAAMLIMAHQQPAHLARMIEVMNCDFATFFIHVDRKVDIAPFKQLVPQRSNVIFLDDKARVKVWWGGFSQVTATLNLIRTAVHSGRHFDRYCLVTGADFPIKGLDSIYSQLNCEKEYIAIERRVGQDPFDPCLEFINAHRFFQEKRVRYYHYLDDPTAERLAGSGKQLRKEMYTRIGLYHGAAYWALTHGCIEYILRFVQENPAYCDFLRHSYCPDELFFHSIVKSSPFENNIAQDIENKLVMAQALFDANVRACHYIDWNTRGVKLPKVLAMEDKDRLLHSPCLFARKFDEMESAKLLDYLQCNCLGHAAHIR